MSSRFSGIHYKYTRYNTNRCASEESPLFRRGLYAQADCNRRGNFSGHPTSTRPASHRVYPGGLVNSREKAAFSTPARKNCHAHCNVAEMACVLAMVGFGLGLCGDAGGGGGTGGASPRHPHHAYIRCLRHQHSFYKSPTRCNENDRRGGLSLGPHGFCLVQH